LFDFTDFDFISNMILNTSVPLNIYHSHEVQT